MKNSLKKSLSVALATLTMLTCFANNNLTQAKDKEKIPLILTFNALENPHSGHTFYSGIGQGKFDEMWKNLPITVTDSKGNVFKSENYFVGYDGKRSDKNFARYGGEYEEGEEVTITIDSSKITDGYHLSYENDYKYLKKEGYNKIVVKIKNVEQTRKDMQVRISLAFMDVKFDLQGGNIDGNKNPITKRVNKDNTANFPKNPKKEGLIFNGWYTKTPKKRPDGTPYPQPDKMYYWDKNSRFSDYNRDWQLYNDPAIDPLYDAVFLLRASWVAQVKFDTNGGNKMDDIYLYENTKIPKNKIENPKKKYAKFLKWLNEDGEEYNFDLPVTKNTILKAKWEEFATPITKNIEIKKGDPFDYKEGITNKDKLPAGTTYSLKNNVDTTSVGTKDVVCIVKYPNGDEKEITYKLTVKENYQKPENTPPQLEVADKEIVVGEALDLKTLITKATDKDGVNLKDKVVIDKGGFDSSKVGTYKITYKVTDTNGASASKQAIVKVKEKQKPQAPENKTPKPQMPKPKQEKDVLNEQKTLPKTSSQTPKSNKTLVTILAVGLLALERLTRRKRK